MDEKDRQSGLDEIQKIREEIAELKRRKEILDAAPSRGGQAARKTPKPRKKNETVAGGSKGVSKEDGKGGDDVDKKTSRDAPADTKPAGKKSPQRTGAAKKTGGRVAGARRVAGDSDDSDARRTQAASSPTGDKGGAKKNTSDISKSAGAGAAKQTATKKKTTTTTKKKTSTPTEPAVQGSGQTEGGSITPAKEASHAGAQRRDSEPSDGGAAEEGAAPAKETAPAKTKSTPKGGSNASKDAASQKTTKKNAQSAKETGPSAAKKTASGAATARKAKKRTSATSSGAKTTAAGSSKSKKDTISAGGDGVSDDNNGKKDTAKKPAGASKKKTTKKSKKEPVVLELTLEEKLESELTEDEIERFQIDKVNMEQLIRNVCDILAEHESAGMLQNDLWKKLKLSDMTGSRLALKLERMGTITREKLLENGRWTYRLVLKKTPISTESIEDAPCLVCPVEQKCTLEGEISPRTCQFIEDWVVASMKRSRSK